ncbi:MAG: hypothetical protein R3C10_03395 [Pirellulales bacterium]
MFDPWRCQLFGVTLRAVVLLLGVVLAIPLQADDATPSGTLETLRHDVRQGVSDEREDEEPADAGPMPAADDSRPESKRSDDPDAWFDREDDEDDDDSDLAVIALTSPFWLPATLVGDRFSFDSEFLDYPYQHGRPGVMVPHPGRSSPSKPWLVRLAGEYGDEFDRNWFARGHLLLDSCTRLGFDGEWAYRHEDLDGAQAPEPRGDDLWTGDANVVFRIAESRRLQMRAGIGINWLSDDDGGDVGFNFTYGGDWLPHHPWIISTEIDWGRVGHVGLFHGRVTVGAQIDAVEYYTGFDYFDVGTAQTSALVAGVRLWF